MKVEIKKIEDEKKLTVEDLFPKIENLRPEITFFDENGNPTTFENAKTSITRLYDANGNLIREVRGEVEKSKTK